MLVRGWLYINDDSAMFISENPKSSFSCLNWRSLAVDRNIDKFLQVFDVLKEDHCSSYKSYFFEIEERRLFEWFSLKS